MQYILCCARTEIIRILDIHLFLVKIIFDKRRKAFFSPDAVKNSNFCKLMVSIASNGLNGASYFVTQLKALRRLYKLKK